MSTVPVLPPPFAAHNIELASSTHGKITKVSVYPGRAEVTRVYKLALKAGVNQVKITGLPAGVERDSLRVEGRGAATIQDVAIAATPPTTEPSSVPALLKERKRIDKARIRCFDGANILQRSFRHLSLENIDFNQLGPLMETFERESAKIDERKIDLDEQYDNITERIEEERQRVTRGLASSPSDLTATVGVFADHEGEAEVVLIYALNGASWQARYDIRVNMQATENPVTLVYKAAISQSTGETWENVSLTLETVTPTYGLDLPTLEPYHISAEAPPAPVVIMPAPRTYARSRSRSPVLVLGAPRRRRSPSRSWSPRRRRSRSRSRSRSITPPRARRSPSPSYSPRVSHRRSRSYSPVRVVKRRSRSPSPYKPRTAVKEPPVITHATAIPVSNFGGLNSTYEVPGLITIPSDSEAHNVTIVELRLSAQFSWMAVPKVDTKVHLRGLINNDSDYTLLPGTANIYVDGSFTSKIDLSVVNPHEDFICGLGLEPAVRLTYHPLVQKSSQSGFVTKSTVTRYTRRITVHNTKPIPVGNLTIIDRIPVSVDSQVLVKLISPPLLLPNIRPDRGSSSGSSIQDSKPMIKVGEGVAAAWDSDGPDAGKDGKLNWLCSIPPQGTVNVALVWDETSPGNVRIKSFF